MTLAIRRACAIGLATMHPRNCPLSETLTCWPCLPAEWRQAVANTGMLILSCFPETATQATVELATRRNAIVAALADEAWFAHISPGGQSERLTHRLTNWGLPFSTLERSSTSEQRTGPFDGRDDNIPPNL